MRVVALLKMAEEAEHHCVGLHYDREMKLLTHEEMSKTKGAFRLRKALLPADYTTAVDKAAIRLRLQWILNCSNGRLNPSRTVLKRVNEFLLSPSSRGSMG